MKNLIKIVSIVILSLIIVICTFFGSQKIRETFEDSKTETLIVISRYNEDLNWLNDEHFDKYQYIVYNKGVNDDYVKSANFKKELKLENVGRETHTYLTHIINNYDELADFTIFVPGSLELENKYERAKRLFIETDNNENSDLLSCIKFDTSVKDTFNDFQIDSYLSSNQNNKTINNDASIKESEIRPFGKWYESTFNNVNIDGKCFTQNAIFGITKDTILKKPKSYYIDLIEHVNDHNNPETGHYFERSWETVFYPYSNVKYVY
jgi:hypothetical protein